MTSAVSLRLQQHWATFKILSQSPCSPVESWLKSSFLFSSKDFSSSQRLSGVSVEGEKRKAFIITSSAAWPFYKTISEWPENNLFISSQLCSCLAFTFIQLMEEMTYRAQYVRELYNSVWRLQWEDTPDLMLLRHDWSFLESLRYTWFPLNNTKYIWGLTKILNY